MTSISFHCSTSRENEDLDTAGFTLFVNANSLQLYGQFSFITLLCFSIARSRLMTQHTRRNSAQSVEHADGCFVSSLSPSWRLKAMKQRCLRQNGMSEVYASASVQKHPSRLSIPNLFISTKKPSMAFDRPRMSHQLYSRRYPPERIQM